MNNRLCIHCYVSGRVQGVWFRASSKTEADKLGITGWARNLSDGRVEVFACGEKEKVKEFYSWLQRGPRLAKVSEVTYEELEWKELIGFETR